MVDEVAEGALPFQCLDDEGAGRLEGASAFVQQHLKAGGGQRLFLASDALPLP